MRGGCALLRRAKIRRTTRPRSWLIFALASPVKVRVSAGMIPWRVCVPIFEMSNATDFGRSRS